MALTDRAQYRLSEQDEYPHAIEEVINFNESMYINLFDHAQQMGGWFRIGNRPNEGHAEVSCCLYLPDGRVGFMFVRPQIFDNDAFSAGGLTIDVTKPFKQLDVKYAGKLCLLDEPSQMEEPRNAFKSNPIVDCDIQLSFAGCAPAAGGERIDENGDAVALDPKNAFFRGHYEQHVKGQGSIQVGDQQYQIQGLGLRDHSWGPRYWQNIQWYRWMPMCFSEDFALVATIMEHTGGHREIWAMVLEGDDYVSTNQVELTMRYDDSFYPLGYQLSIVLPHKTLELNAEVLSRIPLRNRRKMEDGRELQTRIVEAFTRFECDGHVGYGMTENLDQIVDGQPVGALKNC